MTWNSVKMTRFEGLAAKTRISTVLKRSPLKDSTIQLKLKYANGDS
jgi:hypothetical protein